MRLLTSIAFLTVSILSNTALADMQLQRDKVKTGILPAGGFYSIYETTCTDNSVAYIARISGSNKWCALSGASLTCYRFANQAGDQTCASMHIAANDTRPATSAYRTTPPPADQSRGVANGPADVITF